RMSMPPKARAASAMIRAASASFETSAAMPTTLPFGDNFVTAASTDSCRRAAMATLTPSSTRWEAMAKPMPLAPPVITAILPESFSFDIGLIQLDSMVTLPYYESRMQDGSAPGWREIMEQRQAALIEEVGARVEALIASEVARAVSAEKSRCDEQTVVAQAEAMRVLNEAQADATRALNEHKAESTRVLN